MSLWLVHDYESLDEGYELYKNCLAYGEYENTFLVDSERE